MASGSSDDTRLGPGLLFGVVGPSGAGKDTLIAAAKARLGTDDRFSFPRRLITRIPDGSEDSEPISAAEFQRRLRDGGVALHWNAHGLDYGLPASVDADVRAGRTVVVNLSRGTVAQVRARYARSCILLVAADLGIRASRIAARGRESVDEIGQRLARSVTSFSSADADLVMDNSGALELSVERFLELIKVTCRNSHFGHERL